MAPECSDNLLWKCCILLLCLVTLSNRKTVSGGCGDSDHNSHNKHEENKCWYDLWYFWFIVVLVFISIVILVIFYCKHQVKRSTGHRARRRTPVLTVPIAPPRYEVPGHDPPPYHIAICTNNVPPHVPDSASTLTRVALHSAEPLPSLPGYVMDPRDYHGYDNQSMASTISLGTVSSPPPYSPPPTTPAFHHHSQHGQTDITL